MVDAEGAEVSLHREIESKLDPTAFTNPGIGRIWVSRMTANSVRTTRSLESILTFLAMTSFEC